MKRKLLNALAAGIMLVAGTVNALADAGDETTQANIDFENVSITDGVVTGTTGSMTIGNTSTTTIESDGSNSYLVLGTGDNTVTLDNASRENYAKDVVTFSFDMSFGTLNSYWEYVYIKDADDNNIAYFKFERYDGEMSETNLGYTGSEFKTAVSQSGNHGNLVPIVIELDYANGTITTTLNNNDPVVVSLGSANAPATFMVGTTYDNSDRYGYFDNLMITTKEGDYSVATANYTINYIDENNNTVKTDTGRGDVEATISLNDAQKASFYSEDGETRYNYASDDASTKTISSDGTTTVTVNVTSESKVTYTFQSSVGTYTYTGTDFIGNTVSVPYPKYQLVGTTLYSASSNNNNYHQSYTLTQDNLTYTKEYDYETINNVVYYSEAEDINGMTASNNSTYNVDIRCSNAYGAYNNSGSAITATTLGPGIYTIYAAVWGNEGSTLSIVAGDNTLEIATTGSHTSGSKSITLTETTDVTIPVCGSSARVLDYIYIKKTNEIKTINANGFATFSSTFPVQIPSDVIAYTAYISNNVAVELARVEDVVAANNGLLIEGTPGANVTFIIEDPGMGSDYSGSNELIPTTTDPVVPTSGTYVALSATADPAVFRKIAGGTELSAGKAYIKYSDDSDNEVATGAKSLRIIFPDDEASAVKSVTAAEEANTVVKTAEGIYTLSGQKVSSATTPGIYIVNGKKMMAK